MPLFSFDIVVQSITFRPWNFSCHNDVTQRDQSTLWNDEKLEIYEYDSQAMDESDEKQWPANPSVVWFEINLINFLPVYTACAVHSFQQHFNWFHFILRMLNVVELSAEHVYEWIWLSQKIYKAKRPHAFFCFFFFGFCYSTRAHNGCLNGMPMLHYNINACTVPE